MTVASDSLENYSEEQRASLARTALALLNHPDVSKDAKRLIKKIDPKVSFPDVDVEDRFEALREETREEAKKREEAERVRRANEAYEATKQRIADRGFKVEDVEKVMKDKGIANYDTAMEFLENQAQLAPATADSLSHGMEMPSEAQDIMKNPKKWAQNMAHTAVNDLIRARKRA